MKNIQCVFYLFLLLLISVPSAFGQRKTKLNTNGKGVIFGQFGYNRSGYTKADIDFQAPAYSFSLKGVKLTDNEEDYSMGKFFKDSSPQFSAKIGYFFANKWAITASYDRYNTFIQDKQKTNIEGNFSPTSPGFQGAINEEIVLDRNMINIAQRKGVNYISLGIQRNDMLGRTKKSEFALHTLYGVKAGILLTKADYTFAGNTSTEIPSNGFGFTANVGVQLDFYQHVYIQLGLNGGVLSQGKMKLSTTGDVTARQVVGFLSPTMSLGFNLFASTKNNCGTCPQW